MIGNLQRRQLARLVELATLAKFVTRVGAYPRPATVLPAYITVLPAVLRHPLDLFPNAPRTVIAQITMRKLMDNAFGSTAR